MFFNRLTIRSAPSLQSARKQARASIKVRGRVILSVTWAVGQAYRQSESSQRAHPADDPCQNTQLRKKPEKVSCEEHHKFLQYINNLFLHFSYSKSRKLKVQVVIAAQGSKQLEYQNK